jgi:predicted Fe-Mo cluster-binding NifX family protein
VTIVAAPLTFSSHAVHVLAVAADGPQGRESTVAPHFGLSPFYVVMVARGTEVRSLRVVANPHVADHGPGSMVSFWRNLGADVVLAGKLGPGATHRLGHFGIREVTGVAGNVVDAVGEYLRRISHESGECTSRVPSRKASMLQLATDDSPHYGARKGTGRSRCPTDTVSLGHRA